MTVSDSVNTEPRPQVSHARDFGRPGFYVKLVLMMLVNAFGIFGIMASYANGQWAILAFLVVTLLVADYVYFSKKAIPAKYLFPGLVFLLVYQVFVMGMTAYVAFTNYGDGHNDTKAAAVRQIQLTSEVEGGDTFPLTVIERDGELQFAVVRDGEAQVGAAEQPLAPLEGATVDGEKVTAVEGATILKLGDIVKRQDEVLKLRVPVSEDGADGSLRTRNGSTATTSLPRLTYDEAADTFTDKDGTVYKADDEAGWFVSEKDSKDKLKPGWRVVVGFDNFLEMVNNPSISKMFLGSLGWTFAFAILSVLTTFALGLIIAVIFNDPRVKGRTFYRALFILPYAFPGFLAALVWKGMLNRQFGYINEVLLNGANINWLGDGNLAKFSILAVNLWLGFPYMFLVCTGALQAIPGELTEASVMDGAGPFKRFFHVTLPMLMVSVAPLLISSFAFNFNNFSLIYMLTGGGPNYPGAPVPVGESDILISMVYAISFEGGNKQYGLASALSIIIFVVVGFISWLGFRQTRKLEEIM